VPSSGEPARLPITEADCGLHHDSRVRSVAVGDEEFHLLPLSRKRSALAVVAYVCSAHAGDQTAWRTSKPECPQAALFERRVIE